MKQLIVRVSISVSESDYGASISHSDTKLRMGKGDHLIPPSVEAGEAARIMLNDSFNLPTVGTKYDALMKEIEESESDDANEG